MESLLEPVSHVLSHATGLRAAKLGGTNHGHEKGRSCTMPGTENTSMPKHHNDTIGDFLIPCRFCSHYSNSNSNTLVHNLNHNHVFRWTFHRQIFLGTGFIESMDYSNDACCALAKLEASEFNDNHMVFRGQSNSKRHSSGQTTPNHHMHQSATNHWTSSMVKHLHFW